MVQSGQPVACRLMKGMGPWVCGGGGEGGQGAGMTWRQLTERDCRDWRLSAMNPRDKHAWISGVGSASYLEVDVAPVPAL